MITHKFLLYLLLLVLACNFVTSRSATDAEILTTFRKSLSNDSRLSNWNVFVSPCNGSNAVWVGLRCNKDGTIDKLVLDGMGLMGMIDMDSLASLLQLRTLSLMRNNFDGPLPQVNKLSSLRNLYLSNNRFSGEIPGSAFEGMNSLKELYLANNEFTGAIPVSLVGCAKLVKLDLDGNHFVGNIPDFRQNFQLFNVANNSLDGEIPPSLAGVNPSSFAGNNLCGKPLPRCKSSKKKTTIIIGVVVGTVVALIAIVAMATIKRRRNKPAQFKEAQIKQAPTSPDQQLGNDKKAIENGKLSFVRNNRERFDLQDLLRASAEVLGSGTFGSSYKAVLLGGGAMVVKRFRHMNNVGKDEFYEHMRRLGSLSHPNLLPLVAFYYRKEEKLLVSDFIENGSLATHLHGKRAAGEAGLDWPTRLKIIKGVAKGIVYLYTQFPRLTLPHGHLKSSNVLLDHTFEPLLTDYALVPVVNKDHAQDVMVAYKSPELAQSDRPNRKTDVWSLGILILEILTGKFPANYLRQGKGENADLASWVNGVVREEWTGEVFDKEMKGTKYGEGEMLKLLKIGMCCCEWDVERRWDLSEAVEKIEELKERESENEEFSSYGSEGDNYSSRAMTDDDFSFSVNG